MRSISVRTPKSYISNSIFHSLTPAELSLPLSCSVSSSVRQFLSVMATFELYRRSTIGMCLTETLDEMVSNGTLSPELAIQVLVQFDKSMTEALESQVKSKVSIKGHLHTYRFSTMFGPLYCRMQLSRARNARKSVGRVKIVACDSKLLTQ
ncbi:hypothetical protein J5N97_008033 [Dioscorea zingiberensis]|uniref:Transcription initiation factor IIA gamma subunit N-terminal domain-containing protein n=1 Tax=Dioscorea zingiberensis TaxID=325984 RepID=A0A9D5DI38_9LILI|nr:hypothetical protein J5N97_008033 [Dioscorea zingiberensis]